MIWFENIRYNKNNYWESKVCRKKNVVDLMGLMWLGYKDLC